MIWMLLLAALAAHVSCQNYKYTGTILLTQHDFCTENNVYERKCESTFQNYLVANPHIVKCSPDKPLYSNHCPSVPSDRACDPKNTNDVYNNRDTTFHDIHVRTGINPTTDEVLLEPQPSDRLALAEKVTDFSLRLFKAALPSSQSQNYILSPMLVQSLLSYLIGGASDVTRRDMQNVLQLTADDLQNLKGAIEPSAERDPIPKHKLDMASQIYRSTQIEISRSYQMALKANRVPMQAMDFSNPQHAAKTINDWVKQQTRGKILDVVDAESLNPETQLLLLNALYFNGTWMYKFNKTDRAVFHLNDREQSSIKMMYLTRDLRNGYTRSDDSNEGFFWIELPYDGDSVSMILLLPNERFKLDRELQNFTVKDLEKIMKWIAEDEPGKVRVQLPEFKASSLISLVEPLKKMGLRSMFEGEKPFDRISDETIKISDVKQKSFLSVDAHGTVATSVTFATVIPLSIQSSSDFIADQPFAAIIMDKVNKLPLFMAKITQPEKFGKTSKRRN